MSPQFAIIEYREQGRPVAQTMPVTVIAQDPAVKADGRTLTATVRIPAEHLERGPRGARFHVVDYDTESQRLSPPAITANEFGDPFREAGERTLVSDPAFRAQNVYAIAARTLATFEAALGRRLQWAFSGHSLYLVPRAFPEANAYYAFEHRAIYFGYVPRGENEVQTALSHDVVAHETTHAVLDGLRPRFVEPGLPDQPAFHEALADIFSLLSVFSLPEVVGRLLGRPDEAGRLPPRALTSKALQDTALFTLAEQLSDNADRGGGLRRSIELEPSPAWRLDPAFAEPHRRGEVLVAAVMHTLLRMWTERLTALIGPRGADRDRVVEEGVKAADHLLHMMVRAIDFMPPVELEFEDVLDAVLQADEIIAADDRHGYRPALEQTFNAFGIYRPLGRMVDLTALDRPPVYERMNYAVLRSDRDEVLRFIWENADAFAINRNWYTQVQFVRPSVRVGPDGLIVSEVVADYVQSLQLTARELTRRGVALPDGVARDTQVELWGGGVLVFDQFGRAKYHQTKPLDDWDRQQRRLEYLAGHGLRDATGRLGFTLSTPRGQRFAALHVSDERAGEAW